MAWEDGQDKSFDLVSELELVALVRLPARFEYHNAAVRSVPPGTVEILGGVILLVLSAWIPVVLGFGNADERCARCPLLQGMGRENRGCLERPGDNGATHSAEDGEAPR